MASLPAPRAAVQEQGRTHPPLPTEALSSHQEIATRLLKAVTSQTEAHKNTGSRLTVQVTSIITSLTHGLLTYGTKKEPQSLRATLKQPRRNQGHHSAGVHRVQMGTGDRGRLVSATLPSAGQGCQARCQALNGCASHDLKSQTNRLTEGANSKPVLPPLATSS
jgi:hypothetical protein